jgi:hypothetical protein
VRRIKYDSSAELAMGDALPGRVRLLFNHTSTLRNTQME